MTHKIFIALPYSHHICNDICKYLHSLDLNPITDYSLVYDAKLDEITWWFKDERYITMIYLKFGGSQ